MNPAQLQAALRARITRFAASTPAPSIPPRVREASEFRGVPVFTPPVRRQGGATWSLERIRAARDAQFLGNFRASFDLSDALTTDDAIFIARRARLAPQTAVATKLVACDSTRGQAVARKANASAFVSKSALVGIHKTFVDHGVAFYYITKEPAADGSIVDFKLFEWPIEFVRWNPTFNYFETSTKEGSTVPIVHGDGFWGIVRKTLEKPWIVDSCLLPAAFVWAAHANGLTDWASASTAHGMAKLIGELPEGFAYTDADGKPTAEAIAFLSMMQNVIEGNAPAGIRPPGSKTDFISNGSTAWQVFSELITNRERAAARIYLGTDAILGSTGDAPGVDISQLFKVASTIIQGDISAIEQALSTGFYQPWTAVNYGDSRYAPRLEYELPDPDAEKKSEERAKKRNALLDILAKYRAEGFVVDQDTVNCIAAELGVDDPPKVKTTAPATPAAPAVP